MKDILIVRCPSDTVFGDLPEKLMTDSNKISNDYYVLSVIESDRKHIEFEIVKNPNKQPV